MAKFILCRMHGWFSEAGHSFNFILHRCPMCYRFPDDVIYKNLDLTWRMRI